MTLSQSKYKCLFTNVLACVTFMLSKLKFSFNPEEGGSTFLWNTGIYPQICMALKPIRPTSTFSPSSEPQISHRLTRLFWITVLRHRHNGNIERTPRKWKHWWTWVTRHGRKSTYWPTTSAEPQSVVHTDLCGYRRCSVVSQTSCALPKVQQPKQRTIFMLPVLSVFATENAKV
jgi:hypothetical protein